jgi:flagellar hook assembly protein FlgD
VRRLRIAAGAGERMIGWDGRDEGGREAPAGIYAFRVEGGSASVQGTLVKVR